ncbi:MAG: hypothetical protein ACI3W8_06590 [Oscillospiraceae bacterium]
MLSKLLKHEFRATSRVMLPLYLLLLCLAVFTHIMMRIMGSAEHWFVATLGGVSIFAFVVGIIAVSLMSLIIMVNRFHTNLMGPQGYLMMTLPTSTHSLIFSKVLTAIVWFAATAVACILAVILATFSGDMYAELLDFFHEAFFYMGQMETLTRTQVIVLLLEALLAGVIGMVFFCLEVYASIAAGHSFNKHKVLLSFAFFFGFNFLLEILGTSLLIFAVQPDNNFFLLDFCNFGTLFSSAQVSIWGTILWEVVLCAVFYFVTWYMMKKRLNLQ